METTEKKKNRSLTSSIMVPMVEEAIIPEEFVEERAPKLDAHGRARATGRRKEAAARVWIGSGAGVEINEKKFEEYFADQALRTHVLEPIVASGIESLKIFATVKGGGLVGQAGAIRHGIARALNDFDPSLRPILKSAGFLTRDSRKKERKTPGFRTARKPQQFSKR